jgi:hypothetical protein
MEYRNKKTGVVINVKSELGGDWEKVVPEQPAQAKKTPPKRKGNTEK